jgi:hypothetical protein
VSYKGFGLTLIGGMSAATLLTLLLVPVFYVLLDNAREAFGRIVLGARAAPRPTATPACSGSTAEIIAPRVPLPFRQFQPATAGRETTTDPDGH